MIVRAITEQLGVPAPAHDRFEHDMRLFRGQPDSELFQDEVLVHPLILLALQHIKDVLNNLTFDPVETDAVKLEVVMQEKYSAGLYEWTIEP